MERLYLGVDIGTQSIKAIAFDAAGHAVACATENQYMANPRPGWATEQPEQWWQKIVLCIRNILTQVPAEAICGVGVDGVTHSPVPVDAQGRLLQQDVQLYCDKRGAEIVERAQRDAAFEPVWRATRNAPACNWMGIKIRWLMEHEPELYERTACFLPANAYINLRLTGVMGTDPSEASGTMLLEHGADRWSDAAISYFGIDADKLPVIRPSREIIGGVTRAAAEETGLKPGTPVVAGAGDMPCALFGAGLVRPGTCVDLIGTGSVITVFSHEAAANKMIANFRCASPGWSPYLSMDSSGGAYRWFRDVLCKQEAQEAKRAGRSAFEYLSELAQRVPAGAEGVMFLPYLQGERTRGTAYSKATFAGMTPATTTGHLARAVMEGVGYESMASLELLDPQRCVQSITLTGGAAKGDLWSQIKADIYGRRVVTLEQEETAAFGAALLAAVACGEYRDEVEAADATVRSTREFLPDPARHQQYQELYQIFAELHDKLQQPYQRLGKLLEELGGNGV